MDPTEALNRIRHAIERYNFAVDKAAAVIAHGIPERAAVYQREASEAADSMVEHFEALDGWLTRGGFLPDWWRDHPHRIPGAGHVLCGRCGANAEVKPDNKS